MIQRIRRRKLGNAMMEEVEEQSRTAICASSLSLFSPVSVTPSDRTRRCTSTLGRPGCCFLPPGPSSGGGPSLSWTSLILLLKTSLNSSTSRGESCRDSMRLFIISSSWSSCSVSRMRQSCTKVQKTMSPSPPISLTPASRVSARALFIFFTRASCSFLLLGSQSNSLRMSISSEVSISPLPSLSYVLNMSCSVAMRSSVKPAFLRSRATMSVRASSMTATKSSKSSWPISVTFDIRRSGSS
mmetsp:Transcript_20973/g.62558  ORF Transcript_20973/g.62558 Transcript_20973/m.62558 type:complete len:242 (+) Transcript_20973:136-861(+)